MSPLLPLTPSRRKFDFGLLFLLGVHTIIICCNCVWLFGNCTTTRNQEWAQERDGASEMQLEDNDGGELKDGGEAAKLQA